MRVADSHPLLVRDTLLALHVHGRHAQDTKLRDLPKG